MFALSDAAGIVPSKTITVTGMSLVAAIAISGIVYWLQQRTKRTNKLPTKWKPVGKVQSLFIYPLKSGKAIDVNKAECTALGLKETQSSSSEDIDKKDKFNLQDRYFMIYQEQTRKFLTARQKNKTLLIGIKSSGPNSVSLIAPNNDDEISFPVKQDGTRVTCCMHGNEEIDVIDCGDEVAVWLSNIILNQNYGLRLGCYPNPDEKQRNMTRIPFKNVPVLPNYMDNNDFGALSDIASYMVLSQSSVDDLKNRVEPGNADVTVRQFRPNIVVSGSDIASYDEDNWKWIKIGENVILRGSKPCTRCTMVNLDPDKGLPNPNKEPLLTLKKYRQTNDLVIKKYEGESPVFGRYFGLYNPGYVSVGDTVYVPL